MIPKATRRSLGVRYSVLTRRLPSTQPDHPAAEFGGDDMAKEQVQKSKTNKPKLSVKEKKAKKAAKAAKAEK